MDNLNDKISNEAQSQPSCLGAVTCRKFFVRYKYKRRMSKLMKSYHNTCREMAWLQEEAPKMLQMKWAFQQRRIKLYERYLSIYGR